MVTAPTEPGRVDLHLPQVRLRALTWGPEDGPLAVALHGFPDTAHTWRHLGPVLAERGWRVVAPFTRGYAPSGLPTDRSFHVGALMADAVAVHAHLGGDDRAVLVGHDWGAITANALAAHPDSPYARVVSLAVPPISAMARLPARLLPGQARRSWYIGYHQLPLLPERTHRRLIARLWRDWSPAYDGSEDLEHVWAAMSAPGLDRGHRRAPFDYYRALTRPWSTPRQHRHWQAAMTQEPRVPLRYLHGRDDGCMRVEIAEVASRSVPDTHLVEGAGHFLHLERPAEVNALVVEALEG
jgi:pimeloyl-ACP methyl ester carboxylesterase